MRRRAALLGLPAFSTLLGGCAGLDEWAYRARQFNGHIDLINRSRPVAEWLANPATPERTRAALQRALALRAFAVSELALPDNASYQRYTPLDADSVVWNVVATPAHSLTLRTWCAPVMGCVGYRGHFERTRADAQALELRSAGWDVYTYGVPAYSTLGWSNPLGGDPLLSSFLHWREADLARLLFHEMAHQRAYAADDSGFNESYATAVERLGGKRWLALHGSPAAREEYARLDERRNDFRQLTARTRERLQAVYASDRPDEAKRTAKAEVMAQFRSEYEQLKRERWGGFAGYDGWVARANNAAFGVQAAYNALVPEFEALFARVPAPQGDSVLRFQAFHAEVRRIAALPTAEARREARAAPRR